MKEETDDPEQEYEFRMVLRLPLTSREIPLMSSRFHFNTPSRRFICDAILRGALPEEMIQILQHPSLMFVESAIRPIGSDDWMTAAYPVLLTLAKPPEMQPHHAVLEDGQ
jgi:hypothetical protein